jgi:hypothetical protein
MERLDFFPISQLISFAFKSVCFHFLVMCVFQFSLRSNLSVILWMYIYLHVKSPLFVSDFNKTWIFSSDFRKPLKYQISWKFVQGAPICSMQTDRHTDGFVELAIVTMAAFQRNPFQKRLKMEVDTDGCHLFNTIIFFKEFISRIQGCH